MGENACPTSIGRRNAGDCAFAWIRFLETANPFAFWAQAAEMAWLPWLEAARILMLPWSIAPAPVSSAEADYHLPEMLRRLQISVCRRCIVERKDLVDDRL
jgi:hypothetical protein